MMNSNKHLPGGPAAAKANQPNVESGINHLPPARTQRMFFEKRDLPRIRENARNIKFRKQVDQWRANACDALDDAWAEFRKSKNIIFDLGTVWQRFSEVIMLQLLEPSEKYEKLLLSSIVEAIALPAWDYLLDGDTPIGIMRSSMATSRLLFAREVLEERLPPDLEKQLLQAIGDKGAEPLYQAILGMDNPDDVTGWRNDPHHNPYGNLDMSRWPVIFSSNNLRAVPTMGLGLGALALEGIDERATDWLALAEASTYASFALFTPDGSYFEGISYVDYTLRTLLQFCHAHQQLKGTVKWVDTFNTSGFLDYLFGLQAGACTDGTPDIVNFSDARVSICPFISSWIAEQTGDPRAQYFSDHFANPGFYLDLVHYRPDQPSETPGAQLKNYRNNLDWVVCRSGWRENDAVLAFRGGFPANHEHADRNSFFYKIYGERLLTDLFGGAYNRNDPHWALRLTSGHNAVLVDGKGQYYHDGEEGVNEGKAIARVVRFEEKGEKVWWCSDATQGYRLVNPQVRKVVRTMAFAKPDIVLVLDEVEVGDDGATAEVRFFPDNRDAHAQLNIEGAVFHIQRPVAELFGKVAGSGEVVLTTEMLEPCPPRADYVPDPKVRTAGKEFGQFPYIRLAAKAATRHSFLTVLIAGPGNSNTRPEIVIQPVEQGWYCSVDEVRCLIDTTGEYAGVLWS